MELRAFRSSTTRLVMALWFLLITSLMLLTLGFYGIDIGIFEGPLAYIGFTMNLMICVGLSYITFNISRRINMIVSTAQRIINTRDLTQRIPINSPWQDMSKLGQVLNHMLGEIEKSVASTRQVSDNIAHDLRTPLTRLRNHIETMRSTVALDKNTVQIEEFDQLIAECDALLTTFNALLRIANIESGRRAPTFERLNLAPVIEDVVSLYEPIASEKNIHFVYRAEPAFVRGDKDMLFQAFANLLDNAVKQTPPGGDIVLKLSAGDTGAHVMLIDNGPGISDEHKHNVFRRFYRIHTCRSQPGAGLGLSLVLAIIQLHKGKIALSDTKPQGLTVTVTLGDN